MKLLNTVLIIALGMATFSVNAEPENRNVKIANGINQPDFTGDGVPDLIISGHRENNNAHSVEVVSFYVPVKNIWNVVPVFVDNKEKFQVDVSGGADCLLHDFRLLKGELHDPATLIVAEREFGTSFADSATVSFTFYTLKHNTHTESEPGWGPTYSFVKSNVVLSKANYCDVGEAFKNELNLGAR